MDSGAIHSLSTLHCGEPEMEERGSYVGAICSGNPS